jgi:hypothetical protein
MQQARSSEQKVADKKKIVKSAADSATFDPKSLLVVGFQVDKLKEVALCALHALPAICALGDNWRAWRA